MSEYDKRLMRVLDRLEIDPSEPLSAAKFEELLQSVSKTYTSVFKARNYLMTVLDTLASGTLHFDEHGKLRGMNDPALEMFQLPANDLLFTETMEVVHVEDEDGVRITTADLRTDRRIERGRVHLPDGSAYPASVYISVIGEDQDSAGTVILIRNIADRLAQEAELEEAKVEARVARDAERARGRFLANMSHELRTPLNAVIGYAEMLVEGAQERGDDADLEDLGHILHSARQLTGLIGGILDLSKIEAGYSELSLEDLDVVEICANLTRELGPLADVRGLGLFFECPDLVPHVRADAARLRQCLLHLLDNALKFTPQGSVTVQIAVADQHVEVAVRDSGVGIAPDALSRIFMAFSKADLSTTALGGAGLGLTLSQRLARTMGGDVRVQSTVGEGSTFTLKIPRASLG